MEPAVALVFSPEPWVEELHRHCADHGGARIRQVVVEPRIALDESYDTLVVSHRWPGLTPALVTALHDRGRRVLGVFDLAEPAGHEHLVDIGADAVVSSDAAMATFVEAISELGSAAPEGVAPGIGQGSDPSPLGRLVAVGGTGGTGATEIAIALADAAGRGGLATVLVDLDEVAPSVAPRLALAMEPNLRTAIDAAVYEGAPVLTDRPDGAGFAVLGGLPNPGAWAQVRPDDALLVLERLARTNELVIANVGSRLELVGDPGRDRFGLTRAALAVADSVVGVVSPSPVGVVRAVTWAAELRSIARLTPLHMIVNESPRDGFRRDEVDTELRRSLESASLHHVPVDRRVATASWNGTLAARGPYTRAVDRVLGRLFAGEGARRVRTTT